MLSSRRLMQHELNVNGILDVFQLIGLCLSIFLNLHIFYLHILVFNFVLWLFCVCDVCISVAMCFSCAFSLATFFCLFVLFCSNLFAFTLSYFILLSLLFRCMYSK